MLGNILTVIEDQQRGYQRTSKSEELVSVFQDWIVHCALFQEERLLQH